MRLAGHRVDVGQWVLIGLSRHDNLFTLRLEQGGGSREAQARLGSRREIVVHPAGVTVGNGPNTGDGADFQGENWIFSVLAVCPSHASYPNTLTNLHCLPSRVPAGRPF